MGTANRRDGDDSVLPVDRGQEFTPHRILVLEICSLNRRVPLAAVEQDQAQGTKQHVSHVFTWTIIDDCSR
ncbi:MAG: hypothetical protein SF187_11310 [Deltaproteobacteria bacterium]|nr:hypothetical protein [Deltaproteobacteria bacterium]